MAVYQCTLTKTVKGIRHFIYPKSISTNIKHNSTTVYATLTSQATSISNLQTKTTNISYTSGTTTISGILSAGGASVQNAIVNAGEFIDVKKDASGYLLEYTDIDGNKYFTGDVHAPNIDEMLGDLQSYLTVSLSKTTTSLNTRITTLETNYTNMISRFATDEANITANANAITTLNANSSTSGSVNNKIAALETKYGYSSTTSNEYVQVVRDSAGKIAYAIFLDGSVLINDLISPTIDELKERLDTLEIKTGLKKTIAG